jgi:hypothetical protein
VLAKRYRETPAADGNAIKPCIRLIATMNLCPCVVRCARWRQSRFDPSGTPSASLWDSSRSMTAKARVAHGLQEPHGEAAGGAL